MICIRNVLTATSDRMKTSDSTTNDAWRSTATVYYRLTKPGIIRGNLLTAIAGFLLAAGRSVDITSFLGLVAGMGLTIASACVYNNVLDRSIDKRMDRTKNRALVTGQVSVRQALLFATLLGAAGTCILAIYTNMLTVALGLAGIILYVAVYGYAKRTTVQGTVIGSISGAIPPVGGYTAASGQLDGAALILFIILVCWQMPHFYALGIYRRSEYQSAGLPIMPLVSGLAATKRHIMLFTICFAAAALALSLFGYAGWLYLLPIVLISGLWIYKSLQGLERKTMLPQKHGRAGCSGFPCL